MPPDKRPLIIGITGNIGSGKSSFSLFISQENYTVISADQVAKDQYQKPEVRRLLHDRWGDQILTRGIPDPAKIAAIVFKQPTELKFLNSVIHPGVLAEFSRICSESKESVLFFEVPLLFEAGLSRAFDYIILITTPDYTRELRLALRDGSDPGTVRERLSNQQNDDQKKDLVDLVIHNDGSLNTLRKRCLRFLNEVPDLPKKKTVSFTSLNKPD